LVAGTGLESLMGLGLGFGAATGLVAGTGFDSLMGLGFGAATGLVAGTGFDSLMGLGFGKATGFGCPVVGRPVGACGRAIVEVVFG
jgi:hypothetical protein